MQQRHLVTEISAETCHHLRRQRNFRHQDHHRFPTAQQFLGKTDIHQRLAASRYALQQRDARLAAFHLTEDGLIDLLLLFI